MSYTAPKGKSMTQGELVNNMVSLTGLKRKVHIFSQQIIKLNYFFRSFWAFLTWFCNVQFKCLKWTQEAKLAISTMRSIGSFEMKKRGMFVLPGFAKFTVKSMKAKPARDGINPFTKEPCVFKVHFFEIH